jgi:NAD(P)-dependent dehydrogenase (short-subunit alcohol dehydrogenase family)
MNPPHAMSSWYPYGLGVARNPIADAVLNPEEAIDDDRGGLAVATTKSIFITGAGSGMGRAGAEFFHARGWRVAAADRNPDGITALADQLGADRIWTRQVDVTDKTALDAALADFCAGNPDGGLDMMWNNAGIGQSGWFEDVPHDAAMRVVDVNFKAVLTGAYGSLPYLKKTKGSLMFSTSSSSATYGMPQLAVYSATKHAVKGLSEALSVEWRRHGVRVADVLPGLIDTAILVDTPNHSGRNAPTSHADVVAAAPKKGMFRLMPASSVAETAWAAYHHETRLHWYVPESIRWIDRIKGISAELVRGRIIKELPRMTER